MLNNTRDGHSLASAKTSSISLIVSKLTKIKTVSSSKNGSKQDAMETCVEAMRKAAANQSVQLHRELWELYQSLFCGPVGLNIVEDESYLS